jgi:hypothetical protein
MTERENRRYKTRLSKARLKQQACLEDVDFTQKRGLDRALILQLSRVFRILCQLTES